MDLVNKKRSTKYDRVMSRLYNRSRSTVDSSSNVTRHRTPSSTRVGAKPSSSNLSSGVFSELPVVLNDYVPETPVKKTFVVKPRRTIKSLDPAKSPQQVLRPQKPIVHSHYARTRGSAPSVLYHSATRWSDDHYRECLSSRSHTRVRELKNEIQEYQERDKLMKLRSRLYKSCGVVLDDVGHVAQDKAVQADPPSDADKESENLRRNQWLRIIGRYDLLWIPNLRYKSYAVCSAHFEESVMSIFRKLLPDAMPSRYLAKQKTQPEASNQSGQTQCSISTQTEDIYFNNDQTRMIPPVDDKYCYVEGEEKGDLNIDNQEIDPDGLISQDCDSNPDNQEIDFPGGIEQDCDLDVVKKEIIDLHDEIEQNCFSDTVKEGFDPMHNYKNSYFTDVNQDENNGLTNVANDETNYFANDAQNFAENNSSVSVAQDEKNCLTKAVQQDEKKKARETEDILLKKLLKSSRKMVFSKSPVVEKRRRLLEYELSQVKKKIVGKIPAPVPCASSDEK